MRLAIDLQSCQTDSRERGIGRYALGLAAAIAKRGSALQTTVLLDAIDEKRLSDVRRRLRHESVRVPTATYAYPSTPAFTDSFQQLVDAAGLLKSRLVRGIRPDVLLSTSFFEVGSCFTATYDIKALANIPKAVIAYDLIPVLFPDRYLPDGQFISNWYRKKLEQLKKFDLFLAISEATREDLIQHLGIDSRRIAVILCG